VGIQLSWNYNYYYAGAYIGRDLCTNPELVATDEDVMWQTVFWFWTSSTGSTGTTCKEFVDNGSFGGTVKTIVSTYSVDASSLFPMKEIFVHISYAPLLC
jgi:predicted chitinase